MDWFETPPHLKLPEPPKKEFDFKLLPRLRDVLDYDSPIELPPSPELLPEEMEDEFPIATGLPGFPPTPSPPPVSPFRLPPSPEKRFGRQITPEARRSRAPMAARLVTPPREVRSPAPGLVAAHRQYQSLLMDTPPDVGSQAVCPGAAGPSPTRRTPTPSRRQSPTPKPSTSVVTTSETVISPGERRTTTRTTKTTTPSPETPQMMIIPPPHVDPFLGGDDFDLYGEEMPELMEPSPEEEMRRAAKRAPHRTTRRPVNLYGYGERKPLTLERKPRPPCLGKFYHRDGLKQFTNI